MSNKLQLELEHTYSKTYSMEYLKEEFIKEDMYYLITDMADKLNDFIATAEIPDNRPDIVEVFNFFKKIKVEHLLWKLVAIILIKQTMTIAALAGVLFHSIPLENSHRKFLAIEYLLNLIDEGPLVHSEITKGEECFFVANHELPAYIKEHLSHQGYPLPMITAPVVTSNSSIGYLSFDESVIAGGSLKHHDKNIVISNINRANSVAYSCETRLNKLVEFTFNPTPKVKDSGYEETVEDVAKRYESFVRMQESLPRKEAIIVEQGNKFHLAHRVDNRMRRYAKGYELNYQGHKFIKAKVQFHNKELVTGNW